MSHGHKKEVLVEGNQTFHSVTEKIAGIVEMKNSRAWLIGFGISGFFATILLVSIVYLLWEGTGIWGLNNPVGWGWAIVNFVFWVGIGHAGTLISAISSSAYFKCTKVPELSE